MCRRYHRVGLIGMTCLEACSRGVNVFSLLWRPLTWTVTRFLSSSHARMNWVSG